MDTLAKGMTKDEPFLVFGLVDTETVEKAKALHDTYPTATAALGRVISGAVLLSALLKDGQRLVLQVTGDGPLRGVVAEADAAGRVRGYVKRPHIHLGLKDGKLDVGRAIGRGALNVIKDMGLREYYQGTVPLQTGEIATDLAYYLNASEQMPAAVSLGVFVEADNSVRASGGFLVHPLPGASDGAIGELERRLADIRPVTSQILSGLSPREILEEAIGRPVTLLEERTVSYFCPCTRERVLEMLVALGKAELEDMLRKGEPVSVQCRFCMTEYAVSDEELRILIASIEILH